jgi:hypothetical protein
MFKQKRAFTGEGGSNTPAGATNQGDATGSASMAMDTSSAAASTQMQQRSQVGHGSIQDETLIDIPLE